MSLGSTEATVEVFGSSPCLPSTPGYNSTSQLSQSADPVFPFPPATCDSFGARWPHDDLGQGTKPIQKLSVHRVRSWTPASSQEGQTSDSADAR